MRLVTSGVVLFLFIPDMVAAQQNGEGPQPPPPWVLETTVTTGSEYTDNFFRSESKPQSDFRQTITPDLTLKLTGPLHRARLHYRPTAAYSTLLEEPAHFHLFDASAEYDATPFLTVRATDQFSRTDNPSLTDPNTLRVGRTTTTQNLAALELPYRTETWSVTPRGSWTTFSNESDTPLADERSRILTLGADGTVTLVPFNTTLRAGAESTRARFRISDDFSGQTYRGGLSRPFGPRFELTLDGTLTLRQPDRGEDFSIRDVVAGARYEVSETYLLSGRVGYQQTDVSDQPGAKGLTYSTQASYTSALFTFAATSDLSIQESFTQAENVGVVRSQGFGATLTYRPNDALLFTGTGRWSSNEFLESKDSQEDTSLSWTISASYRLTRTFTLTGAWERTQRDSTRTGNTFSANTFRLELMVDLR